MNERGTLKLIDKVRLMRHWRAQKFSRPGMRLQRNSPTLEAHRGSITKSFAEHIIGRIRKDVMRHQRHRISSYHPTKETDEAFSPNLSHRNFSSSTLT